jgi:ubiquitin C-terminal hydrolase
MSGEKERNFEFKLVGVVIHMGTADAGHYYSYINVERNKESKDEAKRKGPEWMNTEN